MADDSLPDVLSLHHEERVTVGMRILSSALIGAVTQILPKPTYPEWSLAPEDGSYPFVTWDDLELFERRLLTCNYGTSLVCLTDPSILPHTAMSDWASLQKQFALVANVSEYAKARGLVRAEVFNYRMGLKSRRDAEAAASALDLTDPSGQFVRATQRDIIRFEARGGITTHYTRKVVHAAPMPIYTMLHGDGPAKPGDMLTGMTVSDPTSFITPTGATNYKSMAISL